MKNIAVIFGGKSVEHDISILTALQTMKAFPEEFKMLPIYIKPDGKMVTADNLSDPKTYINYDNKRNEKEIIFFAGASEVGILKNNKIKSRIKLDCAVLCNHGHGGEDGSLQGLLEMAGVPYTSCGVEGSVLTMNKGLTKIVLEKENIDTPAYVHFDNCKYLSNKTSLLKEIDKKLGFPVIVKPARLGSSVGISICEDKTDIDKKIKNALLFDNLVIVEEFIKNAREFCCAVVKTEGNCIISKVVEIKKGEMFTFEEKYLEDKGIDGEKVDEELANKVREISAKTYEALGCHGVVRVDFLLGKDKLYVNEVNSIPGSLAFNLFDSKFSDLIRLLVREGERREEEREEINYKFSSNAIEKYIEMSENLRGKK